VASCGILSSPQERVCSQSASWWRPCFPNGVHVKLSVLIDCCLFYWCLELILMGLVEFLIYLGCSSPRVHKCLKLSMYHSWKIVADRHIEVGPRPIIHTNAKASRAFGIICSQSGCIRPRWSPTQQRTCCNA
jgi:hypothetical protein